MHIDKVNTKAAKTIMCQFFPVDSCYREHFDGWVAFLEEVKLFGPEDALFPKARVGVVDGQGFTNLKDDGRVQSVVDEPWA